MCDCREIDGSENEHCPIFFSRNGRIWDMPCSKHSIDEVESVSYFYLSTILYGRLFKSYVYYIYIGSISNLHFTFSLKTFPFHLSSLIQTNTLSHTHTLSQTHTQTHTQASPVPSTEHHSALPKHMSQAVHQQDALTSP